MIKIMISNQMSYCYSCCCCCQLALYSQFHQQQNTKNCSYFLPICITLAIDLSISISISPSYIQVYMYIHCFTHMLHILFRFVAPSQISTLRLRTQHSLTKGFLFDCYFRFCSCCFLPFFSLSYSLYIFFSLSFKF